MFVSITTYAALPFTVFLAISTSFVALKSPRRFAKIPATYHTRPAVQSPQIVPLQRSSHP